MIIVEINHKNKKQAQDPKAGHAIFWQKDLI